MRYLFETYAGEQIGLAVLLHLLTAAYVKVFGCRPHDEGATYSGCRRPKTSKGGNRESGRCGGAAIAPRALWGFELLG